MQPYTVLIASVLKPVDDIRMARKIGVSIARLPNTRVHIAGFCTRYHANVPPLGLHPIFCFSRLSLSRAAANFRLLKLALWLKPKLLIIGTHELLPAATFLKLTFGTKVIYDVRENYYRNIRFTSAFPAGIRVPLASVVRALEVATQPVIDHYLLAERTYLEELTFVQHKALVLENKYLASAAPQRETPVSARFAGPIVLLYSGTIALGYGIMEAIALAEQLHKSDSRFHLHIIGYAPQAEVLMQVQEAIKGKAYITLTGGSALVPHADIVKAIGQADFGLLPYRPNPSTDNCIPTKLYEYLANCLPIILSENPLWLSLVNRWDAGFSVSFTSPDIGCVKEEIMSRSFYTKRAPTDVTWAFEEVKLQELIRKLSLEQHK